MATKTCPSCGEEVPVAAARCKSCFYDFNEEPEQNKSGMMGLLVLFRGYGYGGHGCVLVPPHTGRRRACCRRRGDPVDHHLKVRRRWKPTECCSTK